MPFPSKPGDSFNSAVFVSAKSGLPLTPRTSPFLLAFESQPLKFMVREPEGSLLLTFGAVEGRARYGVPTGVFACVDPGAMVEKAG